MQLFHHQTVLWVQMCCMSTEHTNGCGKLRTSMNYTGKKYFSSYSCLTGQPYSIKDNYVKKTDSL